MINDDRHSCVYMRSSLYDFAFTSKLQARRDQQRMSVCGEPVPLSAISKCNNN